MLGKERQAGVAESARKSADIVYLPQSQESGWGGRDVERINQFSIYEIGAKIGRLKKPYEPISAREAWRLISECRVILGDLLNGEPVPINISRHCADQLMEQIKVIAARHFIAPGMQPPVLDYPDEGAIISAYEWSRVKDAVERFETVFAEEMREASTYYVPRRGIFYTPALVDSASEAFPDEIRGHIPDKTQSDWNSAGRCLAFNLLSASGFHVVRAVEGTLEAYYQIFSGNAGRTLRSWHDYLGELKTIATSGIVPCPTQKTIAEIDQMRTDYRNPIVHPRVVLTESDARMLFANGESLIIAMGQEIKHAKETGGMQHALSLTNSGPIL